MVNRNAFDDDDKENHKDVSNAPPPVAKKLKFSPTDLTILIGNERFEYHCHSVHMAIHSDFIHAALATPMVESKTRVIELPDITPPVWSIMMKLLESPNQPPVPTGLVELISAAEKFDQYQFINGLAVCDLYISRCFEFIAKQLKLDPARVGQNMNHTMECAYRCHKMSLQQSKSSIAEFFRLALTLPRDNGNHCGGLIFTQEQLHRLAPLIAEENLLGDRWTEEEVLCPLFPKHFLATLWQKYEQNRFGFKMHCWSNTVALLQLEKSSTERYTIASLQCTTGTPVTPPLFSGGQLIPAVWSHGLQNAPLVLRKNNHGEWVIGIPIGLFSLRVLWKSPMSAQFTNYPPCQPWVKVVNFAPAGSLRVDLTSSQPPAPMPLGLVVAGPMNYAGVPNAPDGNQPLVELPPFDGIEEF